MAEEAIAECKAQDGIQDWQMDIIKTPHQSYTIEEDPILVLSEQGIVKPINEMSLMINAISDKFENNAFICVDSAIAEHPKVAKLIKKLTEGARVFA
jgi:hypothetical protein